MIIKMLTADGQEIMVDLARSISELAKKRDDLLSRGFKVNCYELTGKEKIRIEFGD